MVIINIQGHFFAIHRKNNKSGPFEKKRVYGSFKVINRYILIFITLKLPYTLFFSKGPDLLFFLCIAKKRTKAHSIL